VKSTLFPRFLDGDEQYSSWRLEFLSLLGATIIGIIVSSPAIGEKLEGKESKIRYISLLTNCYVLAKFFSSTLAKTKL
jgi:hypothetical protein